jgi:hypothetical protein
VRPGLAAGALALALGAAAPAHAQDRGAQPTRFDLSATGTLLAGNVRQALVQGRAHLSRSTARGGYDAIGTAFRLWVRPLPGDPLLRVGDDLSLMALPFVYLGEKPYVLGTARAERTAIRGVDGRLNGGLAAGLAPVRRADRLLRVAVGAQAEATAFAAADRTGWRTARAASCRGPRCRRTAGGRTPTGRCRRASSGACSSTRWSPETPAASWTHRRM